MEELNGAIKGAMDERRYELATSPAAKLRSSYCSLAHGKVLADKFHSADEVAAIAAGSEPDCLDEVDRAVMNFAAKVATEATSVTKADVDALRGLGLSDADVVDVVSRPLRAASSARRWTRSACSRTRPMTRLTRSYGRR